MSGPIITPSVQQGPLSRVYVRARAALAALARDPEAPSGLGDEDRAAARLVGSSARPEGGVRLDIASDGLDLGGKTAVERALHQSLGASADELTVYFKKIAASPTGTQGQKLAGGVGPMPLPQSLKDKRAPFGVAFDQRPIPGVRDVVVVASGKGGVGKSTVSVNLAVALAALGARVGLLDADIYGPSAPMMMGLAGQRPTATGDKLVPLTAHGVKVVSFGLLTDAAEPVIWRGPLIAKAFRQLAYDVAWGELDYLIVDLPPGTGDIQLALIESLPIAGALIITTPQDVALLDAGKALAMFDRLAVRVLGLVENMSHFHCPKCGHAEPIFGEGGADRMAAARQLSVLARIPLAASIRARGDSGEPLALVQTEPGSKAFADLASFVRTSLPD